MCSSIFRTMQFSSVFYAKKQPFIYILTQHKGPNEETLAVDREMTAKYPLCSVVYLGPFINRMLLVHPTTIKKLLQSTGACVEGAL